VAIAYDDDVSIDGPTDEAAVAELYEELVEGWNAHDAERFAAPFAEDGQLVGFDGSEQSGRAAIAEAMRAIFEDHETAAYVAKVRSIRLLGADAAVLRAVVGMIPPGGTELMPERNAHQTVVASRRGGGWRIQLFQNTPAEFHGRPELAERLTAELGRVAAERRP
jgi:uncharacterized protein (TIGR02246 family)